MSRRANADARCTRCHLHLSLCLCAELPRLWTRTRLLLVIHRIERRKPTNTGLLAVECLPNSEIWVRGEAGSSDGKFVIDPDTLPLLLFPDAAARPLTDFATSPRPISLIVPDGTWRQAAKMPRRVPALAAAQMVSLPEGPTSLYRLRREPRAGGLATMEAIARAFGILEGPSVRAELERAFRLMVDRTLWARGELDTAEVAGGIPDGARRHDPITRADGAHRTRADEIAR